MAEPQTPPPMPPMAAPMPKAPTSAVAFSTLRPFSCARKSFRYTKMTPHGIVPGSACASSSTFVGTRSASQNFSQEGPFE